jgi:hypothetical protein
MNAPQEVVVAFFLRWLFEALDMDALGIHGADHVPARAILAGAVDALQYDKEAVPPIGIELPLQCRDA